MSTWQYFSNLVTNLKEKKNLKGRGEEVSKLFLSAKFIKTGRERAN